MNDSATRTVAKGAAVFEVVSGPNDGFWDWFASPSWEPETVAAFERLLRPDTRYLDLGAWIGPTVLLAAPRVAHVTCFEPDPLARAELERNLALNPDARGRTEVRREAVAARTGTLTLHATEVGGDSQSSVLARPSDAQAWDVPALDLAEFVELDARGFDFLKIDVEGSEYSIVPALRAYLGRTRPSVYLALHPNLVFDKTGLLTQLTSALRLVRLNHRLLRTLAGYRHHYVYDDARRTFRDARRRNLIRLALPLPLRSCILVGTYLFTDETL